MEDEWLTALEAAQHCGISQSNFLRFLKICEARKITIRRSKKGVLRRVAVYHKQDLTSAIARIGNVPGR